MFVTSVVCTRSPTTNLFAAGDVTVTLAVPLCPSLVAVIVADPAAAAVTSPLPSTLATDVLLLDHVTVRPASAVPLASFGVAVGCTVRPTGTAPEGGATLPDATRDP